jgi:hypothetical protein
VSSRSLFVESDWMWHYWLPLASSPIRPLLTRRRLERELDYCVSTLDNASILIHLLVAAISRTSLTCFVNSPKVTASLLQSSPAA